MISDLMLRVTVEYILGCINSKGEDRPSEVVFGEINSLVEAIKNSRQLGLKHPEAHIVFADAGDYEYLGGDKVVLELIDEYNAAILPGIEVGRIPTAWTQHFPTRKDFNGKDYIPFEFNFSAPQAVDGKSFCMYYEGVDCNLRKAFLAWWHKTHPKFTHPDSKPRYFSEGKIQREPEQEISYKQINSFVADGIRSKSILSLEDLIKNGLNQFQAQLLVNLESWKTKQGNLLTTKLLEVLETEFSKFLADLKKG